MSSEPNSKRTGRFKRAVAQNHLQELTERAVGVLTFVNLPIRKKFLLFFVGVLLWFFALFFVSISTLVVIRSKSRTIVYDLIPWDKTANKISKDIQEVITNASDMASTSDVEGLIGLKERSASKLDDVRINLATLMTGGQINDYSRENNALRETYEVKPLKGDADGEQYVQSATSAVGAARKALSELADRRMAVIKGQAGGSRDDRSLQELNRLLRDSIVLSDRFSAHLSAAYAKNSRDIGFDFACTFSAMIAVLLLSIGLLVLFTHWISNSLVQPLNSIIGQIRSLGEGDISTLKKIEITSRDEIGVLSTEFNGLMESISQMALFKKLIEEDNAIEDVYARLAKKFTKDLGLQNLTIYEVANSQNKMKPVYPVALPDDALSCIPDILNDCSLCRAKKTGHEISSFAYPQMCTSFRAETGKEHICIPMIVGGLTGGVVQFLFDRPADQHAGLKEVERKVFQAKQYIQESLSVLDAKRLMGTLRDSALKDSLTGLYNRRFLQEYTESLVAGILRRQKQVGLLMCDLDYFKQVNDLYGHNTGDAILKETSNIIRNSVRTSDLVIRFGGEEFLVVLLDINADEAMTIAEKIRQNVEKTRMKTPDGTIQKTISLGISEFPKDADTFWQSIKFADVALYKAKDGGRNKALRFTKDMWTEKQF